MPCVVCHGTGRLMDDVCPLCDGVAGWPDMSTESKKLAAFDMAVPGARLVDIGANLTKCSPQDLARQLVRAAAAGVCEIIVTGTSIDASIHAQKLCRQWSGTRTADLPKWVHGSKDKREAIAAGVEALPRLYFTCGVHPHDAKTCDADTLATLTELAKDERCVAIGECGLDYDRMFSTRETQLEWFQKQVVLAVALKKPLFLHERDRGASKGPPLGSQQDLLEIMDASKAEASRACIHCFGGTDAHLRDYVSRGFFIGLTGFVGMRDRGADLRAALQSGALPISKLMLETDCPFMMPDAVYIPAALGVGKKTEPCVMTAVCNAVAECYDIEPSEVAKQTTETAFSFFGL